MWQWVWSGDCPSGEQKTERMRMIVLLESDAAQAVVVVVVVVCQW